MLVGTVHTSCKIEAGIDNTVNVPGQVDNTKSLTYESI